MLYLSVVKVTLKSEEETKEFGRQLGRLLKGGQVIELVGDIGAGKTTFTKGIASGMDIEETVQSPTFTISRVYDAPNGLRLSHYDFYRLSDAGIMADELHESASDDTSVVIIEWGDIVRSILPEDYLAIMFSATGDDVRELDISAHGKKSTALLEALEA